GAVPGLVGVPVRVPRAALAAAVVPLPGGPHRRPGWLALVGRAGVALLVLLLLRGGSLPSRQAFRRGRPVRRPARRPFQQGVSPGAGGAGTGAWGVPAARPGDRASSGRAARGPGGRAAR